MAKTKYDFIKEILKNKKINQNQRERILELASREINLEGTLEERVQKIEEIIYNHNTENNVFHTEVPRNSEDSNLRQYIDPFNLYKFLFEYNQNPILRTTCHDIDSNELENVNKICNSDIYDFNKHLSKIIENYDQHEKKYSATRQITGLIRGYLKGKNKWSYNIEYNWSSPKLKQWAKENPNIPPNLNENIAGDQEIELLVIKPQINSPITYDSIQSFTQLVLHFKNLFHLKSGKQGLRAILGRVNSIKKWTEKVDFEITDQDFPNNLEHFTDVDKLIQAYNKLIQLIIEQCQDDEKPKVKLSFYENDKRVYLSFHHLNGQYNKTLQNCLDRPYGKTYTSLIENQVNGMCNIYLKADFGNKEYACINLWNSKKLEDFKLDSFTGVEHILEFPKIKES